MIAYMMSGADIFDGLNWLRYDYSRPGLTCIAELAFDDPLWDRPDYERFLNMWRRNLAMLQKLQEAMRRYADGGSLDELRGVLPSNAVIEAAVRAVVATSEYLSTKEGM
jgi:hypothetical protein